MYYILDSYVYLIVYIGDLSPFDFFRQEASNQDAVIRTDAMKMVGIVSALMGPEKTRSDMIAFLQSTLFHVIKFCQDYELNC